MKWILFCIMICILLDIIISLPTMEQTRERYNEFKRLNAIRVEENARVERRQLTDKFTNYCMEQGKPDGRSERSLGIALEIAQKLVKKESVTEKVSFADSICVFYALASSNYTVWYYMDEEDMAVSLKDEYNIGSIFLTYQQNSKVYEKGDGTNYRSMINYYVPYKYGSVELLKYYFDHYDYNLGISSDVNFVMRAMNMMRHSLSGNNFYVHRIGAEHVQKLEI